ncbi:hypothetical protein BCAR13_680014 [Paraburkholderia caribensis]|nr:hypothetical protein BCAR13_680014 [Paraburkholderia caribensis]
MHNQRAFAGTPDAIIRRSLKTNRMRQRLLHDLALTPCHRGARRAALHSPHARSFVRSRPPRFP